jgi:hypothetical protein
MIYDLSGTSGILTPSINTAVLATWCMIGGINVILMQDQNNSEIKKSHLFVFLCCDH